MDYTEVKKFTLFLPESWFHFSFRKINEVFKIEKEMFRLIFLRKKTVFLNLASDPGEALILKKIFSSVTSADHMKKDHWNTIALH
ncbi:MmcQ/YjbR family DNA-binding protein [Gammaproteobacteria bacterium]|nr:MmcQ/YjbR family DNA-binding protein [Gammaproteobacteria bacterium]